MSAMSIDQVPPKNANNKAQPASQTLAYPLFFFSQIKTINESSSSAAGVDDSGWGGPAALTPLFRYACQTEPLATVAESTRFQTSLRPVQSRGLRWILSSLMTIWPDTGVLAVLPNVSCSSLFSFSCPLFLWPGLLLCAWCCLWWL